MSGSSLAFSLKNTHMSTKSICFSLVTAFAGPFFSIFCHCHTLIHVTLLCRRASAAPLQGPGTAPPSLLDLCPGWGGPGGSGFSPGLRVTPQGAALLLWVGEWAFAEADSMCQCTSRVSSVGREHPKDFHNYYLLVFLNLPCLPSVFT